MNKFFLFTLLAFSLEANADKYGDFGLAVRIAGSGYIFTSFKKLRYAL